jgi:hypothetical protein
MKYIFAVVFLLFMATVSHAQCPGPDGTAWSSSQSTCVGNSNTSCDSVNQSTCYYANLLDGGWFGGTFDRTSGLFRIYNPGPLPGVQKGDQLRALGAGNARRLTNLRSPRLLTRYTKARPARSLRLRIYRPSTGQYLTVRWPAK